MALTKQSIIEVAVKLFKSKGYGTTSVNNIADELGCTKAALYYYFDSKEEILYEIFCQSMSAVETRFAHLMSLKMPIEERLRKIIYNQIMANIDAMSHISIFFTEKANLSPTHQEEMNLRRRQYEENVAEVFREGIRVGVLKEIDVLPTVYGIIGMCNWLYHWYKPEGRLKPEELAELYADTILKGILSIQAP